MAACPTGLWRDLVELTQQIMGLPRHVTQHVGGVVLSARPIQEFVPVEPTRMEGRVMCQWDKDAVDDARMVKIDFLALGMLSLVDECLDTIEQRYGTRPDLGRISHEDPEVFDQICAGDTIGTFQIESRAQITTLAHTQPRNLDDLAVQVAIVRPGPIVGGAFKPYMEYRRRLRAQAGPAANGEAGALRLPQDPGPEDRIEIKYVHPCLEPVLKDTLGVVLYQEQVVQVAMAVAGYSAGEADLLRRNLNRRRGAELASEDWPEFLRRALERGVPEPAARAAFQSILGFAAYGFPKSHAVAFGLLAYESTWLRHYYPAEFYAALFNNQPMGFYSTEVIAGDARRHGIEIARPDINVSDVGCTVEDVEDPFPMSALAVVGDGGQEPGVGSQGPESSSPLPLGEAGRRRGAPRTGEGGDPGSTSYAPTQVLDPRLLTPASLAAGGFYSGRVRLGLGQVKGVGEAQATMIVAERATHGPLESLLDCAGRTGLPPEALENLILAGAFDDLVPARPPLGSARGALAASSGDGSALGQDPRGDNQATATPLAAGPARRDLLWELGLIRTRYAEAGAAMKRSVRTKRRGKVGLLPLPVEQDMVALEPMTAWEEVAAEYETLGLAPAQHAMALLRPAIEASLAESKTPSPLMEEGGFSLKIRAGPEYSLSPGGRGLGRGGFSSRLRNQLARIEGVSSASREALLTVAEVQTLPDGARVRLAGLVTCRQRPSTAKGVVFVSLEDEYGLANVVVYPNLFDRQRTLLVTQPFLIVDGRVQRQQSVVHIIADHFERPDVHSEHFIQVSHDFR